MTPDPVKYPEQKEEFHRLIAQTGWTEPDIVRVAHLRPSTVRRYVHGHEKASARVMDIMRTAAAARARQRSAKCDSARGRLRHAREAAGLTIPALAKRVKSQASHLRALEEGTAEATQDMIEAICRVLPELEASELMGGSDVPQMLDETAITGTYGARPQINLPSGMQAQYVPLLSCAQAGAMREYNDEIYSHEGVLALNLKTTKAFALGLRGDSMEPRFREGDVAVVYADRSPRPGDVVIAKRTDNTVMCKLFKPIEGGWIVLSSYNPEHPPIPVRPSDLVWVYPVHSVIQRVRPE